MSYHALDDIVTAQHEGTPGGITSVCSAHPVVLETSLRHAVETEHLVLIEATCNQVNQEGGYTGMDAVAFRDYVSHLASEIGVSSRQLILGGDHLGPNPWRTSSSKVAMDKAKELVHSFVSAGYSKIHLDTSMKCADDDIGVPLAPAVVASRSAELAAVAEVATPDPAGLRYVIGTEVPVPGGAEAGDGGIHVTSTASVEETIELTRNAFASRGLESAWERVRAVVVQPGVEFSDEELFDYDRSAASELSAFVMSSPALVFEAHSTDYQTRRALTELVEDHFAILKVGPGLTFAYREGVFALSYIEDELLGDNASHVRSVLDEAMLADPTHWSAFYSGDAATQRRARQFSRSDRSRYYWGVREVIAAVDRMHTNLDARVLPDELLSQFLPIQYRRCRDGVVSKASTALLADRVSEVLDDYALAVGEAMTFSHL